MRGEGEKEGRRGCPIFFWQFSQAHLVQRPLLLAVPLDGTTVSTRPFSLVWISQAVSSLDSWR